ncbi:MAG TPA: prolipoprotein diacylglyceryl transferase family protein, partial [Acidimicrobiales bacterium]
LAQAIGRWGNYFNQELFGRPSSLPWALKIAPQNRPAAYIRSGTFHPIFLYEFLWDLIVVALVLVAERRVRLRKGYLFAAYVALYTFGRFFIEYLRIDFAHKILGLRVNDWISLLVFAGAMFLLVRYGRRPAEPELGSDAGSPGSPESPEPDLEPEEPAEPRLAKEAPLTDL